MKTELASDVSLRALNLVADLFRDESREISGLPYIVHLVAVRDIVASLTDDEEVQIAALLHDVIEDIADDVYSSDDLARDFGERIRSLVAAVSHDGTKDSKELYLKRLSDGSEEIALISGADLLHNVLDLLSSYQVHPDESRKVFGGERAQTRDWFYSARFQAISDKLGKSHQLVERLRPLMSDLSRMHSEIM